MERDDQKGRAFEVGAGGVAVFGDNGYNVADDELDGDSDRTVMTLVMAVMADDRSI